ncbi:MAG: hypothetical protein GY705_06110 [Bacteroidetes bacterium]|nr:hypothetical protein [Bacteroidota bacterium]
MKSHVQKSRNKAADTVKTSIGGQNIFQPDLCKLLTFSLLLRDPVGKTFTPSYLFQFYLNPSQSAFYKIYTGSTGNSKVTYR